MSNLSKRVAAFNVHLDSCVQCRRNNPFALCDTGVRLFRVASFSVVESTCSLPEDVVQTRELLFQAIADGCPGLLERALLTHVALRDDDGLVWSLPRPHRHHQVVSVMISHGAVPGEKAGDEGFLDAHGHYLTRKQAMANAESHGQILGGKVKGAVLTSEDLW